MIEHWSVMHITASKVVRAVCKIDAEESGSSGLVSEMSKAGGNPV